MFDAYASFEIQENFPPAKLFSNFGDLFSSILLILTSTAAALSIIFIIISGIKIITAGGDSKKMASATATLTYAIIGLVVTILAFVILRVIQFFLGANVTPIS